MATRNNGSTSRNKRDRFQYSYANKQNISPKKVISNALASRINTFLQQAEQKEKPPEKRPLPLKEIPISNQVVLTKCQRSGSDITTSDREPEPVIVRRSSSITELYQPHKERNMRRAFSSDFDRTYVRHSKRRRTRTFDGLPNKNIDVAPAHTKRTRPKSLERELVLSFDNKSDSPTSVTVKRRRSSGLRIYGSSDSVASSGGSGSRTPNRLSDIGVDTQSLNRVSSLIEKWKQVEQVSTAPEKNDTAVIISPKQQIIPPPILQDAKVKEHHTSKLIRNYEKLPASTKPYSNFGFSNSVVIPITSSPKLQLFKQDVSTKFQSQECTTETQNRSDEIDAEEKLTNDTVKSDIRENDNDADASYIGAKIQFDTRVSNPKNDYKLNNTSRLEGYKDNTELSSKNSLKSYNDNTDKNYVNSNSAPVASSTDKEQVIVIGHNKALILSDSKPYAELYESNTDLNDIENGYLSLNDNTKNVNDIQSNSVGDNDLNDTPNGETDLADGQNNVLSFGDSLLKEVLGKFDEAKRDSVILFDNIDIGESSDYGLVSDDKNVPTKNDPVNVVKEDDSVTSNGIVLEDNDGDKDKFKRKSETNDNFLLDSTPFSANTDGVSSQISNEDSDTFIRLYRSEDKNEAFNRSLLDLSHNEEEEVILENKEIVTSDNSDIGSPRSPQKPLDLELSVYDEKTKPERVLKQQKARRSRSVSPKQSSKFFFGQRKSHDSFSSDTNDWILSDDSEEGERSARSRGQGPRKLQQSLSADSLDPRHTEVNPLQPGYPILHSHSWDQVDRRINSRPRVHFEDDIIYTNSKKVKDKGRKSPTTFQKLKGYFKSMKGRMSPTPNLMDDALTFTEAHQKVSKNTKHRKHKSLVILPSQEYSISFNQDPSTKSKAEPVKRSCSSPRRTPSPLRHTVSERDVFSGYEKLSHKLSAQYDTDFKHLSRQMSLPSEPMCVLSSPEELTIIDTDSTKRGTDLISPSSTDSDQRNSSPLHFKKNPKRNTGLRRRLPSAPDLESVKTALSLSADDYVDPDLPVAGANPFTFTRHPTPPKNYKRKLPITPLKVALKGAQLAVANGEDASGLNEELDDAYSNGKISQISDGMDKQNDKRDTFRRQRSRSFGEWVPLLKNHGRSLSEENLVYTQREYLVYEKEFFVPIHANFRESAPVVMECQNPKCLSEKRIAVKICHHSDCQDNNDHKPLMLCKECDKHTHSSQANTGHLRFDIFKKGALNRSSSTQSLPGYSKSDTEEDRRQKDDGGSGDEGDGSDIKRNTRLKRKKVLKGRRCHTDAKDADDSKDELTVDESTVMHSRSRSLQDSEFLQRGSPPVPPKPAPKPVFMITKGIPEDKLSKVKDLPKINISAANGDCAKMHKSESEPQGLTERYTKLDTPGDMERSATDNEIVVCSPQTQIMAFESSDEDDTSYADDDKDHGLKPEEDNGSDSISPLSFSYSSPPTKAKTRKISTPIQPTFPKKREDFKRKYSMGQEYFTLKFDLLGNQENEQEVEIVACIKGVSLREAIKSSLDRRNLEEDSVAIYLAASNTALPLVVDTFPLGGNILHVKNKANSSESPFKGGLPRSLSAHSIPNKPNNRDKKTYASQKGKKSPLQPPDEVTTFSDVSPHGTLTGADQKNLKAASKSKSTFGLFSPFGKNQEKQEALTSMLNGFSLNGLPPMPMLLTLGQKPYDEKLFEIESSWTEVVKIDKSLLSKKQKDQQEALWELLHTEVTYIKQIKVVIDLFQCCILNLQNEQLLNEIETEKVFCNINDVYQCNCELWETYMSKVLDTARETRKLLNPSLLLDGFLKFEELFVPYTKYCLEQKAALDYIKERENNNDLFRSFILWAEAQKQCNRLKLQDLIIKPMQRLTKYKLLLKAVLKKTEDETQRRDLVHMIEKVERFVLQVNTVLHQKAEHERLSMIIDRIEAYDVIEAPNEECLKLSSEFCKLDLTCPVPGCGPHQRRHLLLEGGLKFKDASSRMDVYCFLFTDMLLVTKPNKRGDKVKVIKPPMRLDKTVVQLLRDSTSFMLVYLNEYHVATAMYTFQGESAKVWVDHVSKAQEAYRKMRNNAMDQAESRLLLLDIYDDTYEEDYAVFNYKSGYNENSPERYESAGSGDGYMPNSSLVHGHPSDISINRSLSMDSDQGRYGMEGDPGEKRRHNSHTDNPPSRYGSQKRGQFYAMSKSSVSDYNLDSRALDRCSSPSRSPQGHRRAPPPTPDYGAPYYSKPPIRAPKSAIKGESFDVLDEHQRSKLNNRRVSRTEKRYHTADAIQELRKDNKPDSSIHKRLSWNYGTVDISIENGSNVLRGKAFSSDSLRSMPSSSGVSSTGSLHLSPENEICEGEEYEHEESLDQRIGEQINKTKQVQINPRHTEMRSSPQPPAENADPNNESSDVATVQDATVDESNDSDAKLTQQSKHSKSMPDISRFITKGQLKDGIVSAELNNADGQKKAMSHADVLRMKKQLLLNSTLEASEV